MYVVEKTRLENVGQSYFDPGGDFDLEVVLDPELPSYVKYKKSENLRIKITF